VNEIYKKNKKNHILEYELEKYNPFLQKRGYMETSAYLHVYWNKLYINKDNVGFSQYDMKHLNTYENLDKNKIYLFYSGTIVTNKKWNNYMFSEKFNIDFLLKSYNKFFNKNYSINELENLPLSLYQTNIYPVKIYEKLCGWLELLVEEIYPWCNEPPYYTQFGSIGGYTERAISLFNAFEIFEGIEYRNLNIGNIPNNIEKEQYNASSFLNNYSQDVSTKYISNITGNYPGVDYCMFNSICYLNGKTYSCERINKNGKNGLCFKIDDEKLDEVGFNIDANDPRIFVCNNKVYVIFISESPYENQLYSIGITLFNDWSPVFLQVENMPKNKIEKNWAPFVKNNRLFFVYNYDPLIILYYNFNKNGICSVVFKQKNINLPIDTTNTFLRGGSNLIHYKDEYYIGGCHSRIYKNCYEHYSHIILLDTNKWELVYVSKPVMYIYELKDKLQSYQTSEFKALDTLHNILMDRAPNIIQDPVSIFVKNNKHYMTINVRDCVTLLYELQFSNLLDFIKKDKPIGYYDKYILENIRYIK
jgi:hypothetical protein